MGKKVKLNWTSALVGAASATAAAAIILGKPRDPTFQLVSINFTSFKLNLPVIDTDLILTVHVSNPNIVPVHYSSAEMSIFYGGTRLGCAMIEAGSQPPRSCRLLRLQARLGGLQLAHQAARFLADLRRREMVLDAAVDIEGSAKVMWWDHKFRVHVDSHVVVDPVLLDVIDQDTKSEMEVFVV
ncbi:late embryogenesis abundant (LEA) hydroxyproline-rich glycoprotein family [Actinidia rufa]|uniref:Late embryogenesis abundant (LEA) hydroxyproline-rich glycoprotein family n=1 Tax=Actinidia rufa TaxID=165716 RepID=A0A7J0G907_9ERIC|nr:late embryogenesis abundant (LEA) hydroxyproline-rich glycoprotein family [Actinidia rufa]